MPTPTHVTVTAPEGRRSPIHNADGVRPDGLQLHAEHGSVTRVAYSQDVRRAIARGDLLLCDMNGAAADLDKAGAPEEMAGGSIVRVARHAKKGT